MKKRKILLCLFLICLCFGLSGCGAKSTADKLAAFAKQSFLQQDYESCINVFREVCGLNDLDATVSISYDFDYDYDKENKELDAVCHFSFTSDEIDRYATAEYYTPEADELAKILKSLSIALAQAELYEYSSSEGTIKLKIDCPMFLGIKTSTERKYELSGKDWVHVTVDGEWVYDGNMNMKKNNKTTSEAADNGSYQLPNTSRHTEYEAWSCAQNIVEGELKSPSTADFCSFTEAEVTHLGNGEYMVSGWVDAQNSFGAILRQSFVVTYTATEKGYTNGYVSFK